MKSVAAVLPLKTLILPVPSVASSSTALLARVVPALKLMWLELGLMPLPGNRVRKPTWVLRVTVMLTARATALPGMLQEPAATPATVNSRVAPATRAGALAERVSMARQGGTVKSLVSPGGNR